MSRVPDVSDVAAAGERRRRTRVVTAVTAASLAVLLLLGMAVAVLRARHPDHPVTPAPSGTALRRIGEPLPTAREAYTRIVDDRAFVAGYQDGALRVTALNATDGHLMWTQTVAGPHYELSLMNVIGGELVIVDLAADTTTSAAIRNQITVLDLTDGRTLWQRELAGGTSTEPGELPTLTEKVAILTAGEAGAMRAFDWRTGRQRWSLPAGARTLIEPALRAGGNVDIPHGGIDRISTADVFYRADGTTLRAYDLASGRPTGQQWTGLPPGVGDARNLLWHGKLYLVTDTRLSTVDLGGDGPTVGYTAHPTVPGTRVTSRLNGLVPCAGDAICLTDGGNPNDEAGRNPYQVVLLRTGAAPVTRDLGTDDWIVPRGALVCLERGGILDDQLRVATPAALAGFGTVGVDTGGTALLAREPEVSLAYETHAVHLFALQVATQATTDLGEIMAVPGSLAAGDHRLLALTAEGAALYAY
ncbi:outer membrane protein assembly factor BamB family protein [Hamadaea tsunoensis]|uniref:outer membrane protein assembly factor BamB family protein n=1 Tax=Hamadaea tsunoensis TaxID=53368 RepID=UPI002ADE2FC0|nr:PQQ-binding-like beta-propeller repeat protein [Hamadaea tsunoensis]